MNKKAIALLSEVLQISKEITNNGGIKNTNIDIKELLVVVANIFCDEEDENKLRGIKHLMIISHLYFFETARNKYVSIETVNLINEIKNQIKKRKLENIRANNDIH